MGKALIFKGIKINNPVAKVSFVDESISGTIRDYINRLSIVVTSEQKIALETFYQTLVTNHLWDGITYLYPMFGNAKDCAVGLKGGDLIIPQGATYDKGLNLSKAHGGFGKLGRGIKLGTNYPNSTITPYSQYYSVPYGYTSSDKGWAIIYNNTFDGEPEFFRGFGLGYHSLSITASVAISEVIIEEGSKGLFGETHDFSGRHHKLYNNSTVLKSVDDGFNSTTNMGIVGINCSPQNYETHCLNHPINMVILCNNVCHTVEQEKILSDAVSKLSAVLFK